MWKDRSEGHGSLGEAGSSAPSQCWGERERESRSSAGQNCAVCVAAGGVSRGGSVELQHSCSGPQSALAEITSAEVTYLFCLSSGKQHVFAEGKLH